MRSSSGWTKKVGEALTAAGMPKSVFEFEKMLTERGAPVPMPPMLDFPYIGYLEASEVMAAQAAMQNIDLAKVAEATGEAEYGAMAAENVKSWFDEAAAANQGIVAFYS
jgi:hypothetical protein